MSGRQVWVDTRLPSPLKESLRARRERNRIWTGLLTASHRSGDLLTDRLKRDPQRPQRLSAIALRRSQ